MIRAVIFDWGRTLWDKENAQLFSETKEMLVYLKEKGYRLGVLTVNDNTNEKEKIQIMKEVGIYEFFDKVVGTKRKDKKTIEEVASTWDFPYEEIMIIGDRVHSDVRAANEAGAHSIWIRRGKFANELPNTETGEPCHTISTLQEIKDIL